MASPKQKFDEVERVWAQSHPSLQVFDILTFIKKVNKRKAFQDMLVAANVDVDNHSSRTIDVELKNYRPQSLMCAPSLAYIKDRKGVDRPTLLFVFSTEHATVLDVIHRLAHYSMGRVGNQFAEDHGVKFAMRYLELVYRFHEDKASAPVKKEVKTLMVQNRIKTYQHTEEGKLRRVKRSLAEELRSQLAELRD